eukprot:TRINITY_DN68175_c5_g5_i1.p1 TRINITY_DN68175_c5_g5~~TRINITY_DN68175_c5_g5_i1.p1  ORF type:complete len:635 (-),score=28.19 TRINITY_DN68175_c5_g5_i1:644-2548(-)
MRPVLIVGAGNGGLTLANALRQCGLPFMLFERCSTEELQKTSIGGGLGLWGPVLMGMRVLGLERTLLSKGRLLPYAGYRSGSRWLVQASPAHGGRIDRFTSCITLHRHELQQALLTNLPKDSVMTGKELQEFTVLENNSGVRAKFSDGTEYEGELLVGADGINSVVRNKLDPAVTPQYSGYAYWRATTEDSTLSKAAAYESWLPGNRFGIVPMKRPEIFWFGTNREPAPTDPAERRTRQISWQEQDELEGKLYQFSAALEGCGGLVHNTPSEDILKTYIYDVWAPKWVHHDGRVVLLGDAVHAVAPNLAQGAMLAIQDALQLADNLRRWQLCRNPPVSEGMDRTAELNQRMVEYEKQRKSQAWRVRHGARWVDYVGACPAGLAKVRDTLAVVLPTAIKMPIFKMMHRWFLGWNYTPPGLGIPQWKLLIGGSNFSELPASLQTLLGSKHDLCCEGTVDVKKGNSRTAILAKLARLPYQCQNGDYKLAINRGGGVAYDDKETWVTSINGHQHVEVQERHGEAQTMRKGPGWLFRFLPVRFKLVAMPWRSKDASGSGFCVSVVNVALSCWLFCIPLPKFLCPKVDAKFWVADGDEEGSYRFDISVVWLKKLAPFWYKGQVTKITELPSPTLEAGQAL